MTYERFEDLPVWQKAAELYEATEELLEHQSFSATREFRDQLDRAALSVSNNIAEGFERGRLTNFSRLFTSQEAHLARFALCFA
jgi:four helix bundle protein